MVAARCGAASEAKQMPFYLEWDDDLPMRPVRRGGQLLAHDVVRGPHVPRSARHIRGCGFPPADRRPIAAY